MPGYRMSLADGGEVCDGFRCSHCRLVLKDPVQTTQQLLFCRECFEETQRQLQPSMELESNDEQVMSVKKKMDKLLVKCAHHMLGCQWKGEFKDYLEHCVACDHTRSSEAPFGVQPESDITSSSGQSRPDELFRQQSGSSDEVFSTIQYGTQDLLYPPVDMALHLCAIDDRLDDMSKQLSGLATQVEESKQDNDILQATVVQLQRSMMRVQSDTKALRIATAAGFTNRKLTWPIPQLSQKCSGKELLIFSPPFHTEADGYKMCLSVYLDGNGPGHKTHISIFFVIMRGEYDALLDWPFNYKVSITLVNQDSQDESITRSFQSANTEEFRRPRSSMNNGSGFPKFASLSVLRDTRYVQDDTMFIKAEVERSTLVIV